MDIKGIYERMKQKREDFLNYAEETALLCDPSLAPKGERIKTRPQAIVGIQATRSLASSLQKSMFAAGVKPFKLDLSPESWDKAKALGEIGNGITVEQFIRQRLEKREDDVMRALEQKTSRSRFAKIIRRNLVEGTNAFINHPDSIRAYPLRCLVVEREAGEVRLLILELTIDVDPLDQDVAADKKDEKICRYYLVNFEKMEVWQQDVPDEKEGGDRPKAIRIDQPKTKAGPNGPEFDWTGVLTANQFIVPVNEIPDIDGDDYAPGYCYNFLNGFSFINHGEMSLSEAMAAAAWNRPRVKPGSPVSENLRSFFEGRSGEPWLGDEGDVEWLSAAEKIGDWAFVVNLLQRKELGLAAAFAMGLKDRLLSGEMTATEVLQIVDELNTQTHDLVGTQEETMLMPLIRSELDLQERLDPLGTGLDPKAQELIKPVITTGTAAIQKERWIDRFINMNLPSIQKMDPTFRVNGEEIAKYLATTGRVEAVRTFFRTASPGELALQAAIQSGAALTPPPASSPRQETIMTNGGPQPPQSQAA